jgi:hypothetical protein
MHLGGSPDVVSARWLKTPHISKKPFIKLSVVFYNVFSYADYNTAAILLSIISR